MLRTTQIVAPADAPFEGAKTSITYAELLRMGSAEEMQEALLMSLERAAVENQILMEYSVAVIPHACTDLLLAENRYRPLEEADRVIRDYWGDLKAVTNQRNTLYFAEPGKAVSLVYTRSGARNCKYMVKILESPDDGDDMEVSICIFRCTDVSTASRSLIAYFSNQGIHWETVVLREVRPMPKCQ